MRNDAVKRGVGEPRLGLSYLEHFPLSNTRGADLRPGKALTVRALSWTLSQN